MRSTRPCFARIYGWLKPGGLFAGTLGSGDNPAEHVPDFYGAPRYWSHFDGDTNRGLLRDAGFDLVQADEIEDEGEIPRWVIANGLTVGPRVGRLLRARHPARR